MKRAERLVAITQILMAKPNVLIPLTVLSERFGAAKSTISEDLVVVKEGFQLSRQGYIETMPGALGGVRYIPDLDGAEVGQFLSELAARLSVKERILAGGYLYMTDLLFDPAVLRPLGLIFAKIFRPQKLDAVVTIETKGIPLALVTAEALGVPMIIIRHGNKVTEGTSVNINFVSGSSQRIQTMSLSRRALEPGRRVLILDDFMKAGGTAIGMIQLMKEFEAHVVGVGMLVESALGHFPKLVEEYQALLKLTELDVSGRVVVTPVVAFAQ
ncbi:MAG: pur operon repressor [Desulfitobacteriaceae bacterium]|nr:pur operon repressor [Desulfitobacteriaceae bacterium]MDI6878044.1 pur operon repressor [Desulfitobacteriaceae bacterium]MDI6913914.1 pur operon repressor [Desulfitobacteriaceae bacterium]